MSDNPKEYPRLEAELTTNEMARALVEYLIKYRQWPDGVRYESTHLQLGLNVKPSVFSAQLVPLLPEPPK